MSRSVNKAVLIGNVTRDVETKAVANDKQVCTFSIATNRQWKEQSGESREETQFHRIVAWGRLAELCGQLLHKGSKIYAEGRLSTRTYPNKEGVETHTTEIILDDMILLDGKRE